MTSIDIPQTIDALTLEEKASLVVGSSFWTTASVDRLGVPSLLLTDGPHGLRKQATEADQLGIGTSAPATCFPTAATLGSTWDPDLVRRVGAAIGAEAVAEGIAVVLGPGINIKRSPLCGRNFEYLSEDPHVSGELGAALTQGIQSRGVGASVKHYAANNQEADRLRVSADVDERTLREIYLRAFETVVTHAAPWTVMCSYNRINGERASQSPWLLTEVLRDEWGFDGLVVSDWGAVADRIAALAAGLDLEMPGIDQRSAAQIVDAVGSGQLDEAVLDQSVERVLQLAQRSHRTGTPPTVELAAHHALAREAAAAGAVLLSNDPVGGTPLLPLSLDSRIGVIGEFARTPRYQGSGSSQVIPTKLDDALTALGEALEAPVPFAAGFSVAGTTDGDDEALRSEAVALAQAVDTVILFLGLPGTTESEGFDRTHLHLPANQLAILEAVSAVNPRIVVVLANGSVVDMPWRNAAPAILETWLAGQAGGSAIADLLLGRQSPGGRLAETIPLRLTDNPSFGNFPGELGHVRYGEGILVGYRWYDARQLDVAFPFGHGLTYTTFSYGPVTAQVTGAGSDVSVIVRASVTNTGDRPGKEVIQVYVGDPQSTVLRPLRELRAFTAVNLDPGQTHELEWRLDARDFSYWHPAEHRWILETGEFHIEVGASSRDLRGTAIVNLEGEQVRPQLTKESTYAEWNAHPVGGPLLRAAIAGAIESQITPSVAAMLDDLPARLLPMMLPAFTADQLDRLLNRVADSF
ncbi:MAG: glycoside hydrolase family 3 C-terminal domain-containing protein [Propionibacteriaceae bacterium]|nr:glycoside hydrolase family 3 C-terminal domain-containing protein [Propionibacteriaceae bacterium]